MKTTVIYHSADFDGIFCREIARKFLPDAELIGWDYANPKIPVPEGKFYILDLSPECLEPEILPMSDAGRMVWIDHHASAIKKFPEVFPGYRIDGVAACRLAWQYFTLPMHSGPGTGYDHLKKHNYFDRQVTEPYAVRLAGEYDIWDKRDPDAELFQHGLSSEELREDTWIYMLDSDTSERECQRLLRQGECLQYARAKENESIITRLGFTVEFEGMTMLACNHAMFNSHLFTAGIKPEHEALLGFKFDGKQWNVSLYHVPGKEHHDLSVLAVKHGGGGHKGACGFRSKTLPFLP